MAVADKKLEKIADWLEKQVSNSSILDGTIRDKMGLSKTTFYRLKPQALAIVNARTKERQMRIEAVKVQEVTEEVKKGLKSKAERLLILQTQVDELLADIETASKKGSKVSLTDRAYLRKTLRDIQSEISKIEGDYAPEKRELTGKNGEPLHKQPDLSHLTDEELALMAAIQRKIDGKS